MSRLPIKKLYFGVWFANDFVGGLAIGKWGMPKVIGPIQRLDSWDKIYLI